MRKRGWAWIGAVVTVAGLVGLTGCGAASRGPRAGSQTSAPAGAAGGPTQLKVASLDVGSSWYVYAATMAEIFRKNLPSGSTVDVLPYAGGVGNAKLVHNGEADVGLTFSVNGKWALDGTVAYEKKLPKLRALAGGLDQYYVGIIATKRSGITSLAQIRERKMPVRLVTVQVGSQGEFATRQVLEAYGITYDDIKKWGGSVNHTSFDVVQSSMRDGKADMFIQVITTGHPAVSELAVMTDLNFLSLDKEAIDRLGKFGNAPATLPAQSFKGQDQPVQTVGFSTVVFASEDMPEDLAYTLTKALAENKQALEEGHKALKRFDPQKAWQPEKVGMPLHEGAARYYKEKGWMS